MAKSDERIHEDAVLENDTDRGENNERFLVLYNDDHNTFDYVIVSLMEVCNMPPEQAEQCTLIAHYKGSCDVKKGSYKTLRPYKHGLNERGLEVVIA